ncbi:MAG: hypothetical protein P8Y85_10730 [Nitrospirota bacterium]|jgi:hypothetical protein
MKRFGMLSAIFVLAWAASVASTAGIHRVSFESPARAAETPPGWLFEDRWMGICQGADKMGEVVTFRTPP